MWNTKDVISYDADLLENLREYLQKHFGQYINIEITMPDDLYGGNVYIEGDVGTFTDTLDALYTEAKAKYRGYSRIDADGFVTHKLHPDVVLYVLNKILGTEYTWCEWNSDVVMMF